MPPLPAGPLREGYKSSLYRCVAAVCNGCTGDCVDMGEGSSRSAAPSG